VFVFGLILGFGLGVLCMALLGLAKSPNGPTTPDRDNSAKQKEPSYDVPRPSEVRPRRSVEE
jgi:hypothetical protein